MDTAKYALISIPLAAALFVFFPRISPFWQMPSVKSAQTGLGDTVQPGDIAKLAMSDELAFRVEFDSYGPSVGEMYWRAMTMSEYDGRKWLRAERQWTIDKDTVPQGIDPNSSIRYDYQVIAEPSYRRWLFALDTPQINESNISQLTDFSLTNDSPITKTKSYRVRSYPTAIKNPKLGRYSRERNLKIPEDSNPRLTELGQSLALQFSNQQTLIEHVLSQYREQNYYYTLTPPLLTDNSLDEFYFESRAGFCEHYASSFTYLMRAAGIPARLVTGYLGGELNAKANYYAVYQYDAHAWAEVWLADKGWVTVDPTAAVNPTRVSDDMSSLLRQEREAAEASNWRWFSQSNVWLQIRMQFEAIDYQWTRLIVGYSIDKQNAFLSQLLGNDKFTKSILLLVVVFISFVVLLWLWGVYQARVRYKNVWQKPLSQTLSLLEKYGIERLPSQSLMQLADRVGEKYPALNEQFLNLAHSYQAMLYQTTLYQGQPEMTNQGKLFARDCKQFNRALKLHLK